MTLGDRLKIRRRDLGMTQTQLAKAVQKLGGKLSQQNINSIETGSVQRPGALPEIASVLKTTTRWFIDGNGSPPPKPRAIDRWELRANGRDLPCFATVLVPSDPDGAMTIEFSAAVNVERLPLLQSVREAFALGVCGHRMAPAFEQDDTIFLDPSRPPKIGVDMLFLSGRAGTVKAMIRRLEGWTAKQWRVRSFRPATVQTLNLGDWPHAITIVARYIGR